MRRFLIVDADVRVAELVGALVAGAGWSGTWAADASGALALLRELEAQAVLVDLETADPKALVDRLEFVAPELPVVALAGAVEESRILAALRAGARGCVRKAELGRDLGALLDQATAGGAAMSPSVARLVLEALRGGAARLPAPERLLTAREKRVLEQLARGLTYEEAAKALAISPNTVRSYVRSIYEKLAVGSKTEAVLAAMRLGLLSEPTR